MIKLADKLHNARSIDALSDVRRELAANNLMNIYTPIATYLNLFHIKSEFEETGFSILYPHEHQYINSILKKRRERDSSRVDRIQAFLEKEAKKVIKQDVAIFGRIKSEYSIYKKLERKKMYSNEKTIDQVMDLLAFTVLMPTEESCYQYAAMLMRDAHVELRQYDDYIRKAKKNGYRSLHLILMPNGISDRCYEVQIKTPEMHHYNLYGPASHIGYKEEYGEKRSSFEYYWVKDVHRRIYEYRNKEKIKLSEPVCAEMFENKIYLFTPSNEIVEMPVGSTVIDLAYRLHSRIGNKAKSATVNGKKVELDQMLKNGDRLEIVLDEKQKLPQRDWLKFVRTRRARDAIETEYRNHLINSEKGFTPSV